MARVSKKLIGTLSALGLAFSLASSNASAQVSYPQAVQDYNTGKYARASSEFQALKVQYPTNILVHYYSALSEQAVGHIDQARAEFTWVITNGTPQLKAMASTGLGQLANAHTSRSSSPAPMVASAPIGEGGGGGAPSVPHAKVKKVLEFYADW